MLVAPVAVRALRLAAIPPQDRATRAATVRAVSVPLAVVVVLALLARVSRQATRAVPVEAASVVPLPERLSLVRVAVAVAVVRLAVPQVPVAVEREPETLPVLDQRTRVVVAAVHGPLTVLLVAPAW